MFAEDIAAFFGDLAVDVTVTTGGVSVEGRAYFDNPASVSFAAPVALAEPALLGPLSLGLRRGSTVSAEGVSYIVRQVESLDDGALVRALLERT